MTTNVVLRFSQTQNQLKDLGKSDYRTSFRPLVLELINISFIYYINVSLFYEFFFPFNFLWWRCINLLNLMWLTCVLQLLKMKICLFITAIYCIHIYGTQWTLASKLYPKYRILKSILYWFWKHQLWKFKLVSPYKVIVIMWGFHRLGL